MNRRKFNFIASSIAFLFGTIFVFSDGASVTANVIGASGSSAGFLAILGMAMIVGAIGLFIVTMNDSHYQTLELERLVRKTNHHVHLNNEPYSEEEKNLHTKKENEK